MGRPQKQEPIYLKESPSYDMILMTLDRDGHCAIRFHNGSPGVAVRYKTGDALDIYFKDRGSDVVRHVKILAKQNGLDGMTTLVFRLLK